MLGLFGSFLLVLLLQLLDLWLNLISWRASSVKGDRSTYALFRGGKLLGLFIVGHDGIVGNLNCAMVECCQNR